MGTGSSAGRHAASQSASRHATNLGKASASDGFSSLGDQTDAAPHKPHATPPVTKRLQRYAIGADNASNGAGPVESAGCQAVNGLTQSALASTTRIMDSLTKDKQRTKSTVGGSRARLINRGFTTIAPIPDDVICSIAAVDFCHVVLGTVSGVVLVTNWPSGTVSKTWTASDRQVTVLASHGDLVIVGDGAGRITVWTHDASLKCTLTGHTQDVRSIAVLNTKINQTVELLVSGSRDCTLRLWDLQRAECLHTMKILRNVVTRFKAFSPEQSALHDFALVQASEDLRLRFWRVSQEGRLSVGHVFHAGPEQIVALDISPSESFVATGTKGFDRFSCVLSVWDTRNMEQRSTLQAFDNTIEAIRIVPRAAGVMQLIAVSCDASMKCFEFPDLELLWEENASTSSPYTTLDCAYSSEGTAIFTATAAPEVFVWCWPPASSPSQRSGTLKTQHVPLEHPPLLRARGEATRHEQKLGICVLPHRPAEDSDKQEVASRKTGRVLETAPTLGSLSGLLLQVEADAAAFHAKQKLYGSPTRIPQRERIKGVSPLARASSRSVEQDVLAVFSEIDRDSNGFLDPAELREYLGDYLGFGECEITRFLMRAATDRSESNRGVSFESFRKHYGSLNAVCIRRRRNESFLRRPGSIGRQQFCLEECNDCKVLVCDMMDQTFVDECFECRVLLGPSSSSCFIRNCRGCTFWVATQQLRTRDCHQCRFFLYSQTEPVIEKTKDCSFAPWTAAYPLCVEHFRETGFDVDKNFWNAIFDFTPRSGKCNWSIVPFHECECIKVEFEELTEDKQHLIPPDNPTALLSHALLCAPPHQSAEHSGHALSNIPQVRPALPPPPPEGARPRLTVEDDSPGGLTERGESKAEQGRSETTGEGDFSVHELSEKQGAGTSESRGLDGLPVQHKQNVTPASDKAPVITPVVPSSVRPSGMRSGGGGRRLVFSSGPDLTGASQKNKNDQMHGAKSSLAAIRRTYAAESEMRHEDFEPEAHTVPALSATVNEITTVCEDDEDKAEAAQLAAQAAAEAAQQLKEVERAEQDAMEQMWDAATLAARDDISRPSPWMQAMDQPPISFVEALREVETRAHAPPAPLPAIKGLNKMPLEKASLLLSIARTKLDDSNVTHMRVLQNVWRKLHCSEDVPLRISPQWEQIGFQGNDPATDLRGVGILGLLHLLALVERAPRSMQAGMVASRHASRHFPFAVASLNFSKLAMELLLGGKLNTACNHLQAAEGPATDLYLGSFCMFLSRWQRESLSIVDFGRVLHEITALAERNPGSILRSKKT